MIAVSNGDEFKRLIEGLANDVQFAAIHWRLYCDLLGAHAKYPNVEGQSRTFWYLTHRAHVHEAMACLSRAYDQEQRSLHLLSWLRTIRQNLHLFEVDEFKRRLAGNAFVDSLAQSARLPDAQQLAQDLAHCSAKHDPTVKALVRRRNTITAHRSASNAARGQQETGFPTSDFEMLLERAITILNRYSVLFAANSYSTVMVGRDDFEDVFKCVDAEVERSRQAFEEQCRELGIARAAQSGDSSSN